MSFLPRILLTIVILFSAVKSFSQVQNLRVKTLAATTDTIQLDTLTIYPNSIRVYCGNQVLSVTDYYLDQTTTRFALSKICSDSVRIHYRVLPLNLSKIYQSRDTSILFTLSKDNREKYKIQNTYTISDAFGGNSLSKAGSISRGVSFGNNQDLGINSTLNLELKGDIAPNLKLIASVSDDNLPIQPDGNTNKLQEFDQVFIQIYNDKLKLIAGDFWISKPTGYFLTYKKRAQGLTFNYEWGKDSTKIWKTQASGALSKGKFARQIVPGIEGNQGPYRLRGNENEPFIVVLSGTESVFIDGKLLQRGQELDYTINYNTAEVIFTSRNPITKDVRIVVEFQYSDQNYARSLLQLSTAYTSKKFDFWFNAYSEQDAKNQSLQQPLNLTQKKTLAAIGDSLELAQTISIDSIGFFENQVLYQLTDSLGYDSVLVYSINPNLAVYRAVFTFVGAGKGDYVFSNFNALGRVYKWVAPINGSKQGDFMPARILITPKQKQMVTSGIRYRLRKNVTLESEMVYTKNDLNTFSTFNREDDHGVGNRTRLVGIIPLGKDSIPQWLLETKLEIEALQADFSPIEQYRSVEFDRDWNTRNKGYVGNQLASIFGANLKNRQFGSIQVEAQQYQIGKDYSGLRLATTGTWQQNGYYARWDGSYLSSRTSDKNAFIRHRSEVYKKIKKLKIGYIDDHERNRFTNPVSQFTANSYQFFDYQFYLANADSAKNNFKLFYRERIDQRSDSSTLQPISNARTVGGEMHVKELKNQTLRAITSYRELKILQPNLINQTPENTLLGRIEYELRAWNSALTWNTFYEVGSGLELKRSFLYIQVNDGQGIYTWIDYNNDGIKDLNEFEIAQFVDQASYIRVFTPSDEYVKTYSNEFNQSIYWRPERLWSSKTGVKKFLSRFSNQARVRIKRKTSIFNGIEAFNPFSTQIRDTNLIASNTNLRNTLFFNRTSTRFGGEYTFQDLTTKNLLATGFDSRANRYHEISLRWNIQRKFTIETKAQIGTKDSDADYISGRNFSLRYTFLQPSLIYQPNTVFRVTLDGRYSTKNNQIQLGGESAKIHEIGCTFKFNEAEKGSLQGGFKTVNIAYIGAENSALGFEMLEALRPGVNYTWNIGYQRSVSKNMQISVQYNGRKSENSSTIHSGGMEVRAFF